MVRCKRLFTMLVLLTLMLNACQPLIQSPTNTAHSKVELIGHIGGTAGVVAVE